MLISLCSFFRSDETVEARQKRMDRDKIAQQKRYDGLSPNSKRLKNQKRSENRRNAKTKIKSVKKNPDIKENIKLIVESGSKFKKREQIRMAPIVEEPKLSEYERIRQRNIEERENLFQELKMAELKAQAAVGISKDKAK